ncbi:enhancer of mRNA-decapping protein 4 [Pelomyxa schiedti]|nr:enhancer of mRNA-decapping protein 4 [Pelomyxa schiedti]
MQGASSSTSMGGSGSMASTPVGTEPGQLLLGKAPPTASQLVMGGTSTSGGASTTTTATGIMGCGAAATPASPSSPTAMGCGSGVNSSGMGGPPLRNKPFPLPRGSVTYPVGAAHFNAKPPFGSIKQKAATPFGDYPGNLCASNGVFFIYVVREKRIRGYHLPSLSNRNVTDSALKIDLTSNVMDLALNTCDYLAASCQDGIVITWKISHGSGKIESQILFRVASGPGWFINHIVLNRFGQFAAIGTTMHAYAFDIKDILATKESIISLSPLHQAVKELEFTTPSILLSIGLCGSLVAVGDSNGTVYLWNFKKNILLCSWQPDNSQPVRAVLGCANGNGCITCGDSGIKMWDITLAQPQCVQSITFAWQSGPVLPFFDHAVIDTTESVLCLSNKNTKSIFVLRLLRKHTQFDSIREFTTATPVLGLTPTQQVGPTSSCELVYCVETTCICAYGLEELKPPKAFPSVQATLQSNSQTVTTTTSPPPPVTSPELAVSQQCEIQASQAIQSAQTINPLSQPPAPGSTPPSTPLSTLPIQPTSVPLQPPVLVPIQQAPSATQAPSRSQASPLPMSIEERLNTLQEKMEENFKKHLTVQLNHMTMYLVSTQKIDKQQKMEVLIQKLDCIEQSLHDCLNQLKIQISREIKVWLSTAPDYFAQAINDKLKTALPEISSKIVIPELSKMLNQPHSNIDAASLSLFEKSLERATQRGFREQFKDHLIPAYEEATRLMFNNLSAKYDASVTAALQAHQNAIQQVSQQIQAASRKNNAFALEQASTAAQAIMDLSRATSHISSMSERAVWHYTTGIQSAALNNVRARTAPQQNPFSELQDVLSSGDPASYDKAFSLALGKQDLVTVLWLCNKLDPLSVFLSGQLQGVTLLCLVQQLSNNLCTETDLKLKWLQHALVYLDRTQDKLGPVIEFLQFNLTPLLEKGNQEPHFHDAMFIHRLCKQLAN